jgi:hypothetical protein
VAINTDDLLFDLPVLSSSAVMSTLSPLFQLASDLLTYMLCLVLYARSLLFPPYIKLFISNLAATKQPDVLSRGSLVTYHLLRQC